MRFLASIITALLSCVLVLIILRTHKISEDIQLIKTEGYYIYTTKKACCVSSCSNAPVLYSHLLKGHIPSGIKRYGFSKGYCFRYKNRDEVLIIPKINETEPPCTPEIITLLEMEPATDYCTANYESISPQYTVFEQLFLEQKFPPNHFAFILRGDFADIYVIANENSYKELLSIVVSGCKITEVFYTQWNSIDLS